MVPVMHPPMESTEILSPRVTLSHARLLSRESRNVLCAPLPSLLSTSLRSRRALSRSLCLLGEGVFFLGTSVSTLRHVPLSVPW